MNHKWELAIGIGVWALSFAVIPGAGHTFAQQDGKDDPNGGQSFVNKAAESNMVQIKLGQLAEEKGTIRAVKNFSKRVVEDDTKNAKQLKNIASQQSLTLPSGIEKADQNTFDQLSKLPGENFDRAYADDMVRNHTADVTEYLREGMNGQNAALKRYAVRSLPMLERHLDMTRKMEAAVNRKANES
jgi:putative membrane protein